MQMSFFVLTSELNERLVEVDRVLTMNMFEPTTEYKDVCVRTDVSLEYFVTLVRRKWSDVAKRGSVRCPMLTASDIVSVMQKKTGNALPTYESLAALKDRSFDVDDMLDAVSARMPHAEDAEGARRVATRALTDRAILDILPYVLNERTVTATFEDDETLMDDALQFLLEAGTCQSYDVMMRLLRKYSARYAHAYVGRADELDRDAVGLLTRLSDQGADVDDDAPRLSSRDQRGRAPARARSGRDGQVQAVHHPRARRVLRQSAPHRGDAHPVPAAHQL